MNIMISINRNYIGYACVMLMSLKEHHKGILLSVYILHNELQDEDFERMDEVIGSEGIELIPVFVPKGTTKEFQIGNWPEEAAYRLLATDLFAGSVERILHLDADILITGDISEFYNTPFEDNYLVACEDFLLEEERREKCRALARSENTIFFNSGVLLFNIPKLSADGFYYSVYAEIIKKYPNLPIYFPDQDLLNLLFCDKTRYMNQIRYNYMPFFYRIYDKEHFYDLPEEVKKNCSVVHFVGASKPWETTSRAAVDELWWEYAKRTPFYYEMRMQHILTMIRKEQKVNALIDDKLKRILQNMKSEEDMPVIEKLLYQKLEKEFLISDELEKLL